MTNKKEAPPITPKANSEQPKQKLNELQMSWAGKLFFASVATWLGASAYQGFKGHGKAPKLPIKIRGSKAQIKAVMDALTSSRAFQDEINRPGATIDGVINKMKIKDLNKANFERATGKKWPLG